MTTSPQRRVLHIVGALDRGGTETWLMHVLRNCDRGRLRLDFLVHTTQPGQYDEEVRALGGAILRCPAVGRPWRYAGDFARLLRRFGPYDVVHSHVHHYSGNVLRLARRAGVRGRVAHSHNDTSAVEARAGIARRAYLALMRRWLGRHATHYLAASRAAGGSLFGPQIAASPRFRVLHCGIDLAPFAGRVDREAVRAELGLAADALVIGHVGRFAEQKNHRFLVEVAAALAAREPRARLLLVGDGPLRPAIERQVAAAGLTGRVVFAGVRPDVPRLLRGAMDLLALPSLHEGLPIVGMEAQAAGLPLLMADTVTDEATIVPALVHRRALARPASEWAEAILAVAAAPPAIAQPAALDLVARSSFAIDASVRALERLYAAI